MIEHTLSKNNIGIFSYGRKQSQRCPNKMLRPFGNTTLVDILLNKLKALGSNTFFAGYEKEFRKKCDNIGVRFVQRTYHSVSIDEPIIEALSFLNDVNFEYLLIINGCLPFLRPETIKIFLQKVMKNDLASSSAIIQRNNYFFDYGKHPINFQTKLKTLNTKTVKPIYEFANALYFFNRKYFLKNGRYWDWKKVKI